MVLNLCTLFEQKRGKVSLSTGCDSVGNELIKPNNDFLSPSTIKHVAVKLHLHSTARGRNEMMVSFVLVVVSGDGIINDESAESLNDSCYSYRRDFCMELTLEFLIDYILILIHSSAIWCHTRHPSLASKWRKNKWSSSRNHHKSPLLP